MIEKLSRRYELSEKVTSEILRIVNDEAQTGLFPFEDEKYSVNLRIRPTEFDIHFCRSVVMVNVDLH